MLTLNICYAMAGKAKFDCRGNRVTGDLVPPCKKRIDGPAARVFLNLGHWTSSARSQLRTPPSRTEREKDGAPRYFYVEKGWASPLPQDDSGE
jgi:hypothetical protein